MQSADYLYLTREMYRSAFISMGHPVHYIVCLWRSGARKRFWNLISHNYVLRVGQRRGGGRVGGRACGRAGFYREVGERESSSLINARVPSNGRGSWSSLHPFADAPWQHPAASAIYLLQEPKSHIPPIISTARPGLVTPAYKCVYSEIAP